MTKIHFQILAQSQQTVLFLKIDEILQENDPVCMVDALVEGRIRVFRKLYKECGAALTTRMMLKVILVCLYEQHLPCRKIEKAPFSP